MVHSNAIALLVGLTIALVVARYATEALILRRYGAAFHQIAAVPWPIRGKIARPSSILAIPGFLILLKLASLALITPIMVGITVWLRPEWIRTSDIVLAVIYIVAIIAFVPLDRRAMRVIREHYGIASSWRPLLR